MLLMSQQQLTIVNQLLKIKNSSKRVINHDGAFFLFQMT